MIDTALSRENLTHAYDQVLRNKGAAGIDNRSVDELKVYLRQNWQSIKHKIKTGSYQPNPILGVEIPKKKGKTCLLGIPKVGDRLLHQALQQQLSPIFEPNFQRHSYGFVPVFRKGSKGTYQLMTDISALKRLKEKIKSITLKTIPASFDERIERLNRIMTGWINYFKLTNMYDKLRDIDVWVAEGCDAVFGMTGRNQTVR